MSPLVVPGIAALKQHINSEVGVTDYLEVGQQRITEFAELTEDWQWIHTDAERASRESPFGGTVAHGFLILSFLSRFLTAVVKVEGAKLMVNCGLKSVRFLTPVPAAGRIRARVRLRECAGDQGFVQATWRMTIECEGNRFPSCIADWIVRYYE
jgi:acyl dehydratase